MAKPVQTEIDPIAVADRLRKLASDATDENRHTDAFFMELAADVIRALNKERG